MGLHEREKNTRVPMLINTEPSFDGLSGARRVRLERESGFDRSGLEKGHIPEYIESVKEEINFRARALRHQIYEIGGLLCDVKSLLPHGEFNEWVRDNVPFSKETAQNFMRVYQTCLGIPELVEYFNPSALYLICRKSFPEELRRELFSNAAGAYDISQKELMEVAFKWRNGKVNLESPEVQDLMRKQRDREVFKRYQIELKALKGLLRKRLQVIQSLNKRHVTYPLLKEQKNGDLAERYSEIEEMIEGFIAKVDGALMSFDLDI